MRMTLIAALAVLIVPAADAAPKKKKRRQKEAVTDRSKVGQDYFIQGEYKGKFATGTGALQVVARANGTFVVKGFLNGLPGDEGVEETMTFKAKMDGKQATFKGKAHGDGPEFTGVIRDGSLIADLGGTKYTFSRVDRKSDTLGKLPPEDGVVLLGPKSCDFTHRGGKALQWELTDGVMRCKPRSGGDVVTKKKFGSFKLHLEFYLPYMPNYTGQARANSGVYLQDRYECQILDSFGLKGLDNECGGFYKQYRPKVNMCFPPLNWQTYDIDFTAAEFQGGKKVKNARCTVRHNNVLIHDDVEMKGGTAGGRGEADSKGPIRLQDHGDPVAFRNIWVVEK